MNDKENTILSSILTATTGIAKTIKIMREEQKRQSERMDAIETANEWLKDSSETTTKRLIALEENVANRLSELHNDTTNGYEQLTQRLGEDSETLNQSLEDKVRIMVDAITDETASDENLKALAGHHADVKQEFESMNQLKIMRSLIESLSTMQSDLTTLTQAITKNASDFAELAEANSTMAARLGSVDVRLASLAVARDENNDDDLESLNEAVKLLENLD